MKSLFKQTAISLVVFGMAGSLYAAVSKQDNTCWSPQLSGAFIGVEGLDLQVQNTPDYVTVFPSAGGDFVTRKIPSSYQWNWRVYGGILFTENDDLTLSWMQLRTSNRNWFVNSNNVLIGPRWQVVDTWENISGRAIYDLDDVYAVWGHTINFNNPWSVRLAAGVEYARLNNRITVVENILSQGISDIGYASKSRLNGIGPRAELRATLHLPHCLALFGDVNAALFASKRISSLRPFNDDSDITLASVETHNRFVVVPKMGARLGVSYSYVYGQAGAEGTLCRLNTLSIEAGWQAESYIHAIEQVAGNNFTSGFSDTGVANFGDQGVFVGLKFSSDWM